MVWTYGGDPVSLAVQQLVKRLDIPLVFGLHNFAYGDPAVFPAADYVVVPSEFCAALPPGHAGAGLPELPLVVDPGGGVKVP